jgi:hypothetical protein
MKIPFNVKTAIIKIGIFLIIAFALTVVGVQAPDGPIRPPFD